MASEDFTPEALECFAAQLDCQPAQDACSHYTPSPAGMAWLVDAWLHKTGYPVRVGDMRLSVADAAALVRVQ